ncbi:MAG TPA: hypothetical protein VEY88_07100, partial [Archangium sp.]|nr:hypothetical protein [Archangium sp.]
TGPLERVEGSFEELGVPLPKFLRREFLEDSFAMIGPGGLRGTSSLGVLMGPSNPGATKPDGVLLFPVNRSAAPLKELLSRGARPVADSSDTVRIKGSFFRRTQGFLLFGTREEYITQVEPLALEERLSAPGLLADMELDFERWRKTDPASFYSIFKKDDDDDDSHVTALGRGLGMRIFDRLLDRVRVTLVDSDDSLRMRFELDPLAPGEILPLPKPAFPGTALGRVDIAYSSAESSRWVEGVTEELLNAAEKDNLFVDAERARLNVDQVRAVMKEIVDIFWSADAVSIALEPVKGKLVYHQVNQYRSPSHFTERVAAVVKKLKALDQQAGDRGTTVGFTTYSAGGARVARLTFPGKKSYTIDFVDSGTSVRIVGSASNQRRLPALLKLSAEGSLTSGFSGAFDPSAAVDAYLASGGHMALPLRMRANVRGQLITWTTHAEGSAAAVDFDVPKPLAQAFLQLLGNRAVDLEAEDSNP